MKGHWRSIQYPHECVYIHIDYMITLLLSLFSHCALCVCVFAFIELAFASVCQRRTSRSVWKGKNLEEKKSSARPLPLRVSARSSHWATSVLSMCVVARHRRPKGIRWSKEKKGEKTETDMQSKAIEGVPVVHMRTTRFWSFSLSVFLRLCWSSLPIFSPLRLMLI
jgi:hypothetical protein